MSARTQLDKNLTDLESSVRNEEYKKIGLNALSKRAIKEDEMDKKEIKDLIQSIPKTPYFIRERKYYRKRYDCLIENQLCNEKQRVFYYQEIKQMKSNLEKTISRYQKLDLINIIRHNEGKAKNNTSITNKHKAETIGLKIINKILAYIDKNEFLYDDLKKPNRNTLNAIASAILEQQTRRIGGRRNLKWTRKNRH
jgi:hypothetical protein